MLGQVSTGLFCQSGAHKANLHGSIASLQALMSAETNVGWIADCLEAQDMIDTNSDINQLLLLIHGHPSRDAAVTAAVEAVEAVPFHEAKTPEAQIEEPLQASVKSASEGPKLGQLSTLQQAVKSPAVGLVSLPAHQQAAVALRVEGHTSCAQPVRAAEEAGKATSIDLEQLLQNFPKCKRLINSLSSMLNTPLAVLQEYVKRMHLQVKHCSKWPDSLMSCVLAKMMASLSWLPIPCPWHAAIYALMISWHSMLLSSMEEFGLVDQ